MFFCFKTDFKVICAFGMTIAIYNDGGQLRKFANFKILTFDNEKTLKIKGQGIFKPNVVKANCVVV